MDDCIFCDIVAGDAPAYCVHEDGDTLAFLDANPVATGHTLVVPKSHHETVTDLPPGLAGTVFERAREVAAAVERAVDPDGLNLVQANGRAAGQEVFHAHVHVIPRHEGDGVEVRWPAGELSDGDATADAIRAALDADAK